MRKILFATCLIIWLVSISLLILFLTLFHGNFSHVKNFFQDFNSIQIQNQSNKTNNSRIMILIEGDMAKYVRVLPELQKEKKLTCGKSNEQIDGHGRIINGIDAKPFHWTWIASLRYTKSNDHFCAGSLVHEFYIITAAHCVKSLRKDSFYISLSVYDLNEKTVRSKINTYRAEKVFIHEDFRLTRVQNDIALIKLDRMPNFSLYVSSICLPESPEQVKETTLLKNNALVIGWGSSRSENMTEKTRKLQQTSLKVIDNNIECGKYLGRSVNATMLYCAKDNFDGASNVCVGDSGGPLFAKNNNDRYYLYGIVSFVITFADLNGNVKCLTQAPSYYTKVPLFLDWIKEKMSET
jgi:secreted trypsin-like serine protease